MNFPENFGLRRVLTVVVLSLAVFAGHASAKPHVAAAPTSAVARAKTVVPTAKNVISNDVIFAYGFELSSAITFANETPVNGSILQADAIPSIGIHFANTAGTTPLLTFLVDGQEVTAHVQSSDSAVVFAPSQPLTEGAHAVQVALGDSQSQWTFTTRTAPIIEAKIPDESTPDAGQQPHVGASYSDIGSGIDTSKVRMILDNVDVTSQSTVSDSAIDFAPPSMLSDGSHMVTLTLHDLAGNVTQSTWGFVSGLAPEISGLTPVSGVLLAPNESALISANFKSAITAIDQSTIHLYLNDTEVTAQAVIAMVGPKEGAITYTPNPALAPGDYDVNLSLINESGLLASAEWQFTVDSARTYALDIQSPEADAVLLNPTILASALVQSSRDLANSVTFNDTLGRRESWGSEGAIYAAKITLLPGSNLVTVKASFDDGEIRTATRNVVYDAPPVVTVTSPLDWQTFGSISMASGVITPGGSTDLTGNVERPITISGTISKKAASVTINQQQAQLGVDGKTFTFEKFFLHEGSNLLSVNATDDIDRVGTAQLTVYVDQTAPMLTVEAPTDNAVTSASRINVRGVVNDAVEGGINAPEALVKIVNSANGQNITAATSDRYYLGRDIPLEVGANTLVVTATDALGNARSKATLVTRIAAGSRRITLLSGDRQTAAIKSELAKPLVIAAIDKDGLPLVNFPVHFDVLRGSGSIDSAQGQVTKPDGINAARNLSLTTDVSGRATAWLTLGAEASEAGNMVRAWSEQISEDAIFTATGARGVPKYVLVNGASGSQYAQTNSQPLEALTVRIMDEEFNQMIGTTVRFHIAQGDAHFAVSQGSAGTLSEDGQSLIVVTDKDGLASSRPVLGNGAGVVRVEAAALLDATTLIGPAVLQIIVLERKDGPTQFTGVVMDHTGQPLSGVRLSIGRTNLSTVSDIDGKFLFDDQVPAGKIDLYVDGRQVEAIQNGQSLQYPALHFETAIIQGETNQLPHPIYLPPINLSLAKVVGGDQDVTLTIPGMQGFEMIVKAHSVTFPDGSHEGPLVVTPVNGDRLPMVPPGPSGSFGALAWTLQPTSTRFDPPIEVRIPNTTGLQPGRTLTVLQWDHDLATFVPMGRGTVNETGTQIITDPGSGITKAGWGGGPPPVPPNCAENPPPGICPAPSAASFSLLKTTAECSACGACGKQQNATPGTCGFSCVPKTPAEIKFTIDEPLAGGVVEVKTETAEPDDKLFHIKVAALADDTSKTWAFEAHRAIKVVDTKSSTVTLDCTAYSEATTFSDDSTDAKIKDISLKPGGGTTKIQMVTADDANLTIKACGAKEQIQTFKSKLINPSPDTVKSYFKSIEAGTHRGTAIPPLQEIAISDTLTHLACWEPGSQKNSYKQYGNNGLPILNGLRDGGFGMMQVTDADKRTCSNLWDWRSNAVAGKSIFHTKISNSLTIQNNEYFHPGIELKKCIDTTLQRPPIPEPTGLQLMYEAIRENNGGRQYEWVPDKPYVECNIGHWERHLSILYPPDPTYVSDVCTCGTINLVPDGCLTENNATYSPTPAVIRFTDIDSPLQLAARVVLKASNNNDIDVNLESGCKIVGAEGSNFSAASEFYISKDLVATTLSKNMSSAPIEITYNPTGTQRIRLAELQCSASQGRPENLKIPLRVLPPSYSSKPPPDTTIIMTANGTSQLVITNNYQPPLDKGSRPIDINGLPLRVMLKGISEPLTAVPSSASISAINSGQAHISTQQIIKLNCNNITHEIVTETLIVYHNGIAPGPTGSAVYTVICGAAQH